MPTIEYLDEERVKLWDAILQLQKDLESRSSGDEKEAKQSSKKASEYKNKCLKSNELILTLLEHAKTATNEIKIDEERAKEGFNALNKMNESAQNFNNKFEALTAKTNVMEELFDNKEDLAEKISALTELHQSGEEMSSKITATYNNLLKRKNEIDGLYFEIIGYDEKDEETGEMTRAEGIKDKLEQAFTKANNDIDSLKKDIDKFKAQEVEMYQNHTKEQELELNNTKEKWQADHNEISNKIRALLPDALTAGLSHAFSEKRKEEIKDGIKLNNYFFFAILGLVFVSLIPFAINMYMLNDGKTLEIIISSTPRVALAILPLYIPFLWLAYFSNKRINLSKRLVEEYTHKEVLSKTFEGLSNQIQGIENEDISEELRIKLLYNILDVSSENPGKLISDYNKADHPVMDVLEKSFKLGSAVETLKRIPGMMKVAKILDERSTLILENQAEKIEHAIDSLTDKSA